MYNIFNKKGYYYIEVVISIFIITIFTIPILLSLYNSYKSIDSIIFNYDLELINNNMLNEIENMLFYCKDPEKYLELIKNNKIYEFLNITKDEFNEKYGDFTYILYIDNYIFENSKKIKINNKKNFIKENTKKLNYNDKDIDEFIKIEDKIIKLIKTKGYVKLENKIIIDISKEENNNITVFIDMKETNWDNFEININNRCNKFLTIIINKKENLNIPIINYSYDNIKNNKNIFIEVLNYDYYTKIYNIYLEIYNKNNKLIKKSNRYILLKWKNLLCIQ